MKKCISAMATTAVLSLVALFVVIPLSVRSAPAALTAATATKTVDDLNTAYMGETTAHAKYAAYAVEADKEGYKAEARLFRAASTAETYHARNHKAALAKLGVKDPAPGFYHGTPGATRQNLQESVGTHLKNAVSGESYERDSMYPDMIKNAKAEGQKDAVRSETYALRAEGQHAALYTAALKNLGHNKSVPFYSVCTGCGATWAGKGPDPCPVCGRPRATFRRVK